MNIVLAGLVVAAATFAVTQSPSISQSFQPSSSNVSTGTLLSRSASSPGVAEPATATTASSLIGIAASSPALELSNNGKGSVQVVVSGLTDALVSDANGTVMAGDKITASPLAGIGMKAIVSGEVVGTAQASLGRVKTVTQQIKNKDGKTMLVHVGLLPVQANVVYYSAVPPGGSIAAYVPPFLQSVANTVAGKAVSPLRVLVALVVLVLGFIAVIAILYGGVHSGIISLGRNPLAAGALRRGMMDILLIALGILLVVGVTISAVILA